MITLKELLALTLEEKVQTFDKMVAAMFSHIDGRDLLKELHPRRMIDIKRRVDGVDTWFEGDWLSNLMLARDHLFALPTNYAIAITEPQEELKGTDMKEIDTESTGRAKGGRERARKLSPERRKEISQLAITARWAKRPTDSNDSVFAQWRGQIDLGGDLLDVYVLNTKQRVISLRATVKAIAEADSGDLAKFIGVSSLNGYINKDLIVAELVEFSIPGNPQIASGLTTEHFELICRGYVRALYEKAPLTDRQREIAIKFCRTNG